MLVELEWLQALVARHCPTFYLHPDDRYLPSSAEFFIRNSDLRQAPLNGGPAQVLLPRGAVAGPLLLEAQAAAPPGSRLWLDLDPAARVGEPLVSAFGLPAGWLCAACRLAFRWPACSPRPSVMRPPPRPQASLAGVPLYAHPKAVVGADGQAEAVEITYVTVRAWLLSLPL